MTRAEPTGQAPRTDWINGAPLDAACLAAPSSTSWSTCCHTTVLPIPASPVRHSTAGVPDAAEGKARISAISASRPTGFESISPPTNRV
jgi:hypothetical protein